MIRKQTDMRQEHRLGVQETVFIEVNSKAQSDDGKASIVISHSIDISANGLQVIVDEELATGNIYQVCVQVANPERRVHLIAEVKWCLCIEDDSGFLIGLSLFESDDTDIQQWKEMIAERFN